MESKHQSLIRLINKVEDLINEKEGKANILKRELFELETQIKNHWGILYRLIQ